MSTLAHLVFFLIFQTLCSAQSLDVINCGKGLKVPLRVTLEGCSSFPCKLLDNTEPAINVTFAVPFNSDTLVPKVKAQVGLLWIPYKLPVEKQNGCNYLLNGYCPMDKGEVLLYQLKMPIQGYPAISLLIELKLLGDNNEPITCMRIPCEVVSNPEKPTSVT